MELRSKKFFGLFEGLYASLQEELSNEVWYIASWETFWSFNLGDAVQRKAIRSCEDTKKVPTFLYLIFS